MGKGFRGFRTFDENFAYPHDELLVTLYCNSCWREITNIPAYMLGSKCDICGMPLTSKGPFDPKVKQHDPLWRIC